MSDGASGALQLEFGGKLYLLDKRSFSVGRDWPKLDIELPSASDGVRGVLCQIKRPSTHLWRLKRVSGPLDQFHDGIWNPVTVQAIVAGDRFRVGGEKREFIIRAADFKMDGAGGAGTADGAEAIGDQGWLGTSMGSIDESSDAVGAARDSRSQSFRDRLKKTHTHQNSLLDLLDSHMVHRTTNIVLLKQRFLQLQKKYEELSKAKSSKEHIYRNRELEREVRKLKGKLQNNDRRYEDICRRLERQSRDLSDAKTRSRLGQIENARLRERLKNGTVATGAAATECQVSESVIFRDLDKWSQGLRSEMKRVKKNLRFHNTLLLLLTAGCSYALMTTFRM